MFLDKHTENPHRLQTMCTTQNNNKTLGQQQQQIITATNMQSAMGCVFTFEVLDDAGEGTLRDLIRLQWREQIPQKKENMAQRAEKEAKHMEHV